MKTRKYISYRQTLYSRGFIAIVSLVLTLAFTSCSNDPIFAAIEKEVELEDPSIKGTVSSLVVIGANIYAANGYVYRRANGTGGWHEISFDVKQIGSGYNLIFAFTQVSSDRYAVYITTAAGATNIGPMINPSVPLPVGCAGNSFGSYFATKTGVYTIAGTPLTGGSAPSTELAGIAIGNNGDVYTANNGYAYRFDGADWSSVMTDLGGDHTGGVAVLQTPSKNLLLITCDEGYSEISLHSSTDPDPGAFGTEFAPGSSSLSSTHPGDEEQYDSSISNYNLNGIYAVTSPAVPAVDEYVIYVGVTHPKYNGLWAYYDKSRTEWNRE